MHRSSERAQIKKINIFAVLFWGGYVLISKYECFLKCHLDFSIADVSALRIFAAHHVWLNLILRTMLSCTYIPWRATLRFDYERKVSKKFSELIRYETQLSD